MFFSFAVSVIEIYNEEVRDLLATDRDNSVVQVVITDDEGTIHIKVSSGKFLSSNLYIVTLPNLTEVEVCDLNSAFHWYKVAATKRSSRSTLVPTFRLISICTLSRVYILQ